MDHTLLTVVHPRTIARVKMNAKQEQEYYDRAEASQELPEKVSATMTRARRLVRALLTLMHATRGNPSHGLIGPKAS